MIKISIIVPVYNVQFYLNRCVDSILKQCYKDLEIILVDDGSTDESGKICDEYTRKYLNIRTIHKSNGGLSDARNVGLKAAIGEYVLFIDSDDYIENDIINSIYKCTCKGNIDIVIGDYKKNYNDNVRIISHNKKFLNMACDGKEFLKNELRNNTMGMEAWRNLYNRKFLINNNLFFKYGILHEDEQWTPRVFLKANTVIYSGSVFYNYVIRCNSITQKKNKTKNAIDLLNTCYCLEAIYRQIEDNELKALLNEYLLRLYLGAFYMGKMYKLNEKKYLRDEFIKGKAKSKKNKLKVLIYSFSKRCYYAIHWLNEYIHNKGERKLWTRLHILHV